MKITTELDLSSLSPRDRRLVERAVATLESNIIAEASWSPRRGICPSPRTYPGVWNWDNAFHALATVRWDPALAYDQIALFLENQRPDGMLVDVVWPDGRVIDHIGKPPVMPWALEQIYRRSPDREFLAMAYPKLARYEEFWREQRGGDAEGLFHYSSEPKEDTPTDIEHEAGLESGWDNSPRWDGGATKVHPIDLNCFMVMLYRSMDFFANELGLEGAEHWRARASSLGNEINARLWDDTAQCYGDRLRGGDFSKALSPASFMPLFCGIAPLDRAEAMLAIAASGEAFFPGMPTVSYSHPEYRSDQYWRGPMWLNVAWFATEGFRRYDRADLAEAYRERILGWCDAEETYLYEYYDSRTGKGLGAEQFGWTAAFVIEFALGSP
ncbi:MAG: trehalase family glycosidase [Armatimonadota bacterium]